MATSEIEIDGPTIRLGQLLKLAGLVDSGGEARPTLAAGQVLVNGAVELRRGRQVRHGDVVVLGDRTVRVAVRAGPDPSAGPH